MEFIDEDTAKIERKKLQECLETDPTDEISNFTSHQINWADGLYGYDEAKSKALELMSNDIKHKLIFIATPDKTISGKPQLIHENIQRIPLIKKTLKTVKKMGGDGDMIYKYFFLDDTLDKRREGEIIRTLAFDFYIYRVVDKDKEYYILSEKKLPNEYCDIEGMKINLDDVSEITGNLRIKKISSIFICKSAEPNIKVIPVDELVEFVKEKEIDEEKFHNMLFLHPDGNIYDYTDDFNLLRKCQLLSSKYEGYPLHMMKMGPVGTGKTTEAEVLDFKFQEDQGILEAGNSTLKALVPSFKEKPANLGYICKCNRVALVDEMMKMVEAALGHDNARVSNYFGQMNMLYEHKDRMVGSGNDNSTKVKATAKIMVTTNNVTKKNTISEHLGIIDPTTLSRGLVWVQDKEEVEKIYNKEGIKSPPNIDNTPKAFSREVNVNVTQLDSSHRVGGILFDDFLTIYDSCQKFIINFDKVRCKKTFDMITNLSKEPMRQVWRARGLHHTILILDGIVKNRCLFIDQDKSFAIKDEDYDTLERLLVHMVNGWETKFSDDSWRL